MALTAQRAEHEGALTPAVIDEVAAEARHSPQVTSSFVQRAVSPTSNYLEFFGLDTMPKFAADVAETTKLILERFSSDRTIVLLGRDMNPFTSLLRANGRKVVDFHFSRLQRESISNTAAQWRAEVPPHAVVIDSRTFGTIHDEIKTFDSTVEPYLLESNSKYPQLLPAERESFASELELFPKMTGRCTGYRASGAAVCRWKSQRDDDDRILPSLQAAAYNRALLRDAGLSNWYMWRYENFTGVPQAERIGISSPSRIQQYLAAVADSRAKVAR